MISTGREFRRQPLLDVERFSPDPCPFLIELIPLDLDDEAHCQTGYKLARKWNVTEINLPFVSVFFIGIYNFENLDSTIDIYSDGGIVANLKSQPPATWKSYLVPPIYLILQVVQMMPLGSSDGPLWVHSNQVHP